MAIGGAAPHQGFGHSHRRLIIEIVAAIGGLLLILVLSMRLASCAAGSMVRFVPVSVDRQLGELAALAVSGSKCENAEAQAYVQGILDQLLAASGDQRFTFTMSIADSDAINAFAAPGGIVVVNRGLLEKAETGEEVAGVLAHEIQHVLGRHGMVNILRQAGGKIIIGIALGWADVDVLFSYAGDLMDLAYSRDHERDADNAGRAIMKKAGMDPRGLARFFARLKAEGGAQPPPILSTHPDHDERIAAAERDAVGFVPTQTLPVPPRAIKCK